MRQRMKAAIAAVLTVTLLLTASCRTKTVVETVEVPTVERVTDVQYVAVTRLDSIWLHDSIYVDRSRDTVLIERWHTKNVLKVLRDTVRVEHTDSVPLPVYLTKTDVQTVEVVKPVPWYQRALQWLGGIALAAIAALVGWRLVKRWLRSHVPKI